MNRILLAVLVLGMSATSHAQINLEHHYLGVEARYTSLETNGWKIHFIDRVQDKLEIYNTDHSPWKTIDLNTPANNMGLSIMQISEHRFNEDDEVEFVCLYGNDVNQQVGGSNCISGNGQLLLEATNAIELEVADFGNLGKKVLVNRLPAISQSGELLSLPGFAAQSFYNSGRISFFEEEPDVYQYGVLDQASWVFRVYDGNDNELEEIFLSVPHTNVPVVDRLVGQNLFDDDAGSELGVYSINTQNGDVELDFFDDDGSLLAAIPGASNGRIVELIGGERKLIVSYMNSGSQFSNVYAIPGFALENIYNGVLTHWVLEGEGDRYTSISSSGDNAEIWYTDHTLDRSIDLGLATGETVLRIQNTSKHIFNTDDGLEMVLRVSESGNNRVRVINENKEVLLENAQANEALLSLVDNEYKLVLLGGVFPLISDTWIYDLQGIPLSAEELVERAPEYMSVYPNPAQNCATIRFSEPVTDPEIRLYNLQGKLTYAVQKKGVFTEQPLDLGLIPAGSYVVEVQDSRQIQRTKLLLVD